MVMPCGLTPVEGIDFADLFYFSMYACAHVRPTQTHTDQCTVRCLWRVVAYWTSASASKEQCHPRKKKKKKKSEYTLEDFAKGGERHSYNIQGTAQLLRPKNNLVKHLISSNWWLDRLTETVGGGGFIANNNFWCHNGEKETSRHSTWLSLHTFKFRCSLTLLFLFFVHRIKIIFEVLNWTNIVCVTIIWSQIQPCFNVCVEFDR